MGCPHTSHHQPWGENVSWAPELGKLEMIFHTLASLQLFSRLGKSWLQTILGKERRGIHLGY